MASSNKRKKKKKKKKRSKGSAGGTMSGMRTGLKGLAGTGPKKKEGLLGRLVTYLLLAAAIGLLIYRFAGR